MDKYTYDLVRHPYPHRIRVLTYEGIGEIQFKTAADAYDFVTLNKIVPAMDNHERALLANYRKEIN